MLTTIPLTDARGKTDVARELMLWPGARDYYRVGAGHRYLAVRGGVLSTSSPHHFHEWRWVNAALTELVWLARLTGRVLVWPRIFDFQQYHHAADHVDLRSVEEVLGGWRSWRESTFFANPRLDVANDATYASLALRGSRATVTRRNHFDGPPVHARSYVVKKTVDAWAVALADPDLRDASVVTVDVDAAAFPLSDCFHMRGSSWSCASSVSAGRVPRARPGPGQAELVPSKIRLRPRQGPERRRRARGLPALEDVRRPPRDRTGAEGADRPSGARAELGRRQPLC